MKSIDPSSIRDALDKLDATNDGHWTADGKPAMKAVEELLGDTSVTRADVDKAAPDLRRPSEQHQEPAPANTSNAKLARRAVAAVDEFLGGADRFTLEDAELAASDGGSPAEFYANWLKRNRPSDVHKRPYHMLSAVEKARIGVFLAVARG